MRLAQAASAPTGTASALPSAAGGHPAASSGRGSGTRTKTLCAWVAFGPSLLEFCGPTRQGLSDPCDQAPSKPATCGRWAARCASPLWQSVHAAISGPPDSRVRCWQARMRELQLRLARRCTPKSCGSSTPLAPHPSPLRRSSRSRQRPSPAVTLGGCAGRRPRFAHPMRRRARLHSSAAAGSERDLMCPK